MKVSELTKIEIAEYLKLDYSSLTLTEIAELETLLSVAKAFIKSYTGIQDISIADIEVGEGDGETIIFYLSNTNIIPNTQKIYVDSVEKTKDIDYKFDPVKGKVEFFVAPELDEVITADYDFGLDAFEEFVIVVYILVQDMYDNRTFYVEKNNLNKVVDIILGMHSINLL